MYIFSLIAYGNALIFLRLYMDVEILKEGISKTWCLGTVCENSFGNVPSCGPGPSVDAEPSRNEEEAQVVWGCIQHRQLKV
jgi:hypothetical protein